MYDNRIFTFYVNPHTDELVKIDGMDPETIESLKGQGVTQLGSWFVADAWNWGTSTMIKWRYSNVSKSAKYWHMAIEKKRASLAELEEWKSSCDPGVN